VGVNIKDNTTHQRATEKPLQSYYFSANVVVFLG